MKIALVEPVGGHGGLEIYDYGVCSSLARLGNEIHFYTCDKTTNYVFHDSIKLKKFFHGIYQDSFIIKRIFRVIRSIIRVFVDIRKNRFDIIYMHIKRKAVRIDFRLLFWVK